MMRSFPARPKETRAPVTGPMSRFASPVTQLLRAAGAVGAMSAAAVAALMPAAGWGGPVLALAVIAIVAGLAVLGLRPGHPHPRLGMANFVTLFRAGIAAVLAGALTLPGGLADAPQLAWPLVGMVAFGLALDGVDGWLARRSGLASPFGARFDMEVDAFLAAVLCLVALQAGKSGLWLLPLGFLRYAWVVAGLWLPWLSGALPERAGRKTACVVQIAVLIALIAPPVTPPLSIWLAGAAMAALGLSFAVDALWLWRRR